MLGGEVGSAAAQLKQSKNFNNVFKKIYSLWVLYVIPRRLCNGLGQLKLKCGWREGWEEKSRVENREAAVDGKWQEREEEERNEQQREATMKSSQVRLGNFFFCAAAAQANKSQNQCQSVAVSVCVCARVRACVCMCVSNAIKFGQHKVQILL